MQDVLNQVLGCLAHCRSLIGFWPPRLLTTSTDRIWYDVMGDEKSSFFYDDHWYSTREPQQLSSYLLNRVLPTWPYFGGLPSAPLSAPPLLHSDALGPRKLYASDSCHGSRTRQSKSDKQFISSLAGKHPTIPIALSP